MGFDEWREGEAVKAMVASPVEPKVDVLGRSNSEPKRAENR